MWTHGMSATATWWMWALMVAATVGFWVLVAVVARMVVTRSGPGQHTASITSSTSGAPRRCPSLLRRRRQPNGALPGTSAGTQAGVAEPAARRAG